MIVAVGSRSNADHVNRSNKSGPSALNSVTKTLAVGEVNRRVVFRLLDGVVEGMAVEVGSSQTADRHATHFCIAVPSSVAATSDTVRIGHGQPADVAGYCAESPRPCPLGAIPSTTAKKVVWTSYFPRRSQWCRENISFQLREFPCACFLSGSFLTCCSSYYMARFSRHRRP